MGGFLEGMSRLGDRQAASLRRSERVAQRAALVLEPRETLRQPALSLSGEPDLAHPPVGLGLGRGDEARLGRPADQLGYRALRQVEPACTGRRRSPARSIRRSLDEQEQQVLARREPGLARGRLADAEERRRATRNEATLMASSTVGARASEPNCIAPRSCLQWPVDVLQLPSVLGELPKSA